jgi:hypothetical protein
MERSARPSEQEAARVSTRAATARSVAIGRWEWELPSGARSMLGDFSGESSLSVRGRVYFLPPHWCPRVVEASLWRVDLDGVVVLFTGPSIAQPPVARDCRVPASWFWA